MLSHVMERDSEGRTVPGPDPNVMLVTPCAFITKKGAQAISDFREDTGIVSHIFEQQILKADHCQGQA
jgi:hypothetical protein